MELRAQKAIKKKNRALKIARKREYKGLQTALYKCFLCHHEFPAEFMGFYDDTICENRRQCAKRTEEKYEHYAEAIEGDYAWWKGVKEKAKSGLAGQWDADAISDHVRKLKTKKRQKQKEFEEREKQKNKTQST